jgi:hypothetical protein
MVHADGLVSESGSSLITFVFCCKIIPILHKHSHQIVKHT